ncbi:Uu.00g116010.m01.CDS01 [Anthostomella pinea]|uniref:Uu.00g116010.m01.CDS01 n=1 Tax=Anthostomella pinea TaxID=933095 RepID=A0AAI8VAR3_9PEZI|nr:Uu.00g116010.m01.CDS01 [Anthostomella pinea]
MTPPLITLEEHFLASSAESLRKLYSEQLAHIPGLSDKMQDTGPLRLQSMDQGHVSFQIMSHVPGGMPLEQCRAANDQCAAAIKANPTRFAGFAVLPMADPEHSAQELRRCIKDLGFVGALIDNRNGNTYYDGEEYLLFWEAAEELNVPIYLHPTWPTQVQTDLLYTGNFTTGASASMGASGWGWHSDVALHVLRLFASGVFDKFPRLKIAVGHMGEMLPFMLQRIAQLSVRWGQRTRLFRQVYDENIWITTSGVWSVDPMATILRNTRIEHILYSVDYPFAKNEDGLAFMRELEASGLVTPDQLERIAYKNSEELFGVKATKTFG